MMAWTNISPMHLVIYKNMFHVKHAYNNPLDEEML